ncbi:MAG: zinc-finger-containing protein [Bacteroidota bacterium]
MIEVTDRHRDIFYAKICPYCGSKTRATDEFEIYGRSYSDRKQIVCVNYPKCDAHVGCHSTGKPLGRLANKELRSAKKEAHEWFDKLWKHGSMRRNEAYARLSTYLGIPGKYTHIGMFGVETCKKVVEFSKEELSK